MNVAVEGSAGGATAHVQGSADETARQAQGLAGEAAAEGAAVAQSSAGKTVGAAAVVEGAVGGGVGLVGAVGVVGGALRRGMWARAAVGTRLSGEGRTVLALMRSAPPLTLRQTGPHAVHLVATAAGPLGGDRFELDLDVAAGTTLEVGSIASTLVLPGEGESLMVVTARVGSGATLLFTPEPTVLAAGCAHRMVVRLALEGDARVVWREEIIFGRYGEAAGRCHSRFDATLDGRALLRQEFVVGDPTIDASPAVFGDARCVGNILIVASPHADGIVKGAQEPASGEGTAPGSHRPPFESRAGLGDPIVGDGVAVLPLTGPGTLISALGRDAVELRQRLAWGQAQAEATQDPPMTPHG